MQTVQLRDRRQITLPPAVVAQAQLQTADELSIRFKDGVIELRPIKRAALAGVDIRQFLGSVKTYGDTPEQVQAYLRAERDGWDR